MPLANPTIEDVKEFWESNPLWTGACPHPAGSKEYFEDHRTALIKDIFAGEIDPRIFPARTLGEKILDLGCGPGVWIVEFGMRGYKDIVAADLTNQAIQLAKKRCEIFLVTCEFSQQNAEDLTFPDGMFSHMNCAGVIHHTPNTQACIKEIHRVLRPNGTAAISVYHHNLLLKCWPLLGLFGKTLHQRGFGLKGRLREQMFLTTDWRELVRRYDGGNNPVGKAYSEKQFLQMLTPFFVVKHVFLHYFPARAVPFRLPQMVHRILNRHLGLMIYAIVEKG